MDRDLFNLDVDRLLEVVDFSAELKALNERHQGELEHLLLSLFEVLDSFDRLLPALRGAEAALEDPWRSVECIARQLEGILKRVGVRAIDCSQQRLDPESHEVVETRVASNSEDEVILEVVTRGYEWNGKLLRRARVIVAGNP